MLFNRYKEVADRCLELGAKMDTLTNEEGSELRRLLEEQAWLSKTIARQAKGALEEVRRAWERIDSWMNEAYAQVERALDQKGIPSDILALEDVISQAASLRDKARNLMLESESKGQAGCDTSVRRDQKKYPQAADIRIDFSPHEESKEAKTSVAKSKQEINSAVEEVAASTTELLADVEMIEPDGFEKGLDGFEEGLNADEKIKSIKQKSKKSEKIIKQNKSSYNLDKVDKPRDICLVKPNNRAFQSTTEPMTYKLSQDIITRLEKNLAPELLPQKAPCSETELPLEGKSRSKKARAKRAKRKKK